LHPDFGELKAYFCEPIFDQPEGDISFIEFIMTTRTAKYPSELIKLDLSGQEALACYFDMFISRDMTKYESKIPELPSMQEFGLGCIPTTLEVNQAPTIEQPTKDVPIPSNSSASSTKHSEFINLPKSQKYCQSVDTAFGMNYCCALCGVVPVRSGRPYTIGRWNEHEQSSRH
jgi:hypothetical protein